MKSSPSQHKANFKFRLIPLFLSLLLMTACGLTKNSSTQSGTTADKRSKSTTTKLAATTNTDVSTASTSSSAAPSSTVLTTPVSTSTSVQALDLKLTLKEQKAQFVVVGGQVPEDAPYAESILQTPLVECNDLQLRQTLQKHLDELYAAQVQSWDQFTRESAESLKNKGDYRNIFLSRTKLSEDKHFYYLLNELMYAYYQSEGTAPRYFNLMIDRRDGRVLSFEEVLKVLGMKRSELLKRANDYILQNKLDTQGKVFSGEEINGERVFFSEGKIFMLIPIFSDFRGELTDELHEIGLLPQ